MEKIKIKGRKNGNLNRIMVAMFASAAACSPRLFRALAGENIFEAIINVITFLSVVAAMGFFLNLIIKSSIVVKESKFVIHAGLYFKAIKYSDISQCFFMDGKFVVVTRDREVPIQIAIFEDMSALYDELKRNGIVIEG
jgi:hypothetical protein